MNFRKLPEEVKRSVAGVVNAVPNLRDRTRRFLTFSFPHARSNFFCCIFCYDARILPLRGRRAYEPILARINKI